MRKLIEALQNDAELNALKDEYEMLTGEYAPPYHYDNFNGIEDYKNYIRSRIEDQKTINKVSYMTLQNRRVVQHRRI